MQTSTIAHRTSHPVGAENSENRGSQLGVDCTKDFEDRGIGIRGRLYDTLPESGKGRSSLASNYLLLLMCMRDPVGISGTDGSAVSIGLDVRRRDGGSSNWPCNSASKAQASWPHERGSMVFRAFPCTVA